MSYKTSRQQEEVSTPAVDNELSESAESADSLGSVPRRSRRETVKPVKKKKITFEGILHFSTDFPCLDFGRWLLRLPVCSIIFITS